MKYLPFLLIILVIQILAHIGYIMPDASIDLGILSVRWYGIFMMIAVLSIIFISKFLVRNYKSLRDIDIVDIALWAAIPGVILARTWHVMTDWYLYTQNPLEAFYIWRGGLSIFGAVLGAVLGVYIYTKRNHLNFFKIVNIAAFSMPLAQIIGRYGNLFNRELFGPPSKVFWALYVPFTHINHPAIYTAEYFHPAYLYEQLGNLCVLGINLVILRKYKLKHNYFIINWLISYGILRFVVEFYRLSPQFIFGLSFSQIVSIVMVLIGIVLLLYNYKRYGKKT